MRPAAPFLMGEAYEDVAYSEEIKERAIKKADPFRVGVLLVIFCGTSTLEGQVQAQ